MRDQIRLGVGDLGYNEISVIERHIVEMDQDIVVS